MTGDSWSVAVELVARFLKKPARLSHLLERMPPDWDAGRRRTCQSLLFGTIRHLRLLEKTLDDYLRRRPKPGVWAALLVASRELMEEPARTAKIVHHAVERIGRWYSRSEKGLANAVLRKVPDGLRRRLGETPEGAGDLAWRYSHPEWLVRRWITQFGLKETRAFLEWNQREPAAFGWWLGDAEERGCLMATEWEDFFELGEGAWGELGPLLREGRFYVQNPAAGIAPGLLAERFQSGRVLDLCAAPGGKALRLEKLLGGRLEKLVAVDLPGPRMERMKENLARYGARRIEPLAGDALKLDPAELGQFEAVLLDAPCSNSGVMQRKIDARWRRDEADLRELLDLQAALLAKGSELVAPGGALVYSTCSVDGEENEQQIVRLLTGPAGGLFDLEESKLCLPWAEERDGAGVFVLRRRTSGRHGMP